jgi:hypothetical protein
VSLNVPAFRSGHQEIAITIRHGPVMHQMRAARVRMAARVGLARPQYEPTYTKVFGTVQ